MNRLLRLPDGTEVAHHSAKAFHVVVPGRGRVASSDERGRALSQWRRWQRNTEGPVWLVDADGHVVRPLGARCPTCLAVAREVLSS